MIRVSSEQVAQNVLYGIQDSYSKLSTAISQSNSGLAIQQPSDNPAGTTKVLDFNNQIADLTQYDNNMSTASGFMSTSSSALTSISNLLQQANQIGLEAANGTNDSTDLQGLASQIGDIITQVAQLGNTQYGSQYVFAGQQTSTIPFAQGAQGDYQYNGGTAASSDSAINITVGQNQSMQINVPGEQAISSLICGSAGPPAVASILGKLQTDIADGDTSAISSANSSQSDLGQLSTAMSAITDANATLGSQITQLTNMQNTNKATITSLTGFASSIEDVDLPTALVSLQSAQTAYQAALESASQTMQNSLLNYLK
jgi:flagellar hook-associated protein 3 FlgL